ncbi:MAG: SAF domain-containing protein [Pirellulaceae bacterium]
MRRSDGGPDSSFSLEPSEFKAMVDAVRNAEKTLGSVQFGPSDADKRNRDFRRSLFVVEDMAAGDEFTAVNVRSIRPGHGLEPMHFDAVIGKRANQAIERGTPLRWDHVGE